MACVRIVTVGIVLSTYLIPLVTGTCSPGKFGESCFYSCHCGDSCNQTSGVCGGGCESGWVGGNGANCQKENVAYRRTASSPTLLYSDSWSADKAVDGTRDQDVHHGSCFNAADSTWGLWTVDLGKQYRIHDVKIYQPSHALARIRSCVLYLSDTSSSTGLPCYAFPSDTPVSNGGIYSATCDGIGRYFSISNTTFLNLCEVEIYVCSPGLFGETCNEFCYCAKEACDHVSGLCPGDCRPGWQGDRCDTECDANHYGVNCVNTCTDRKCSDVNSSCDRYSGSCDRGCLPGWRGVDCSQECSNGTYGQNCSMTCSERKCAGDSSCDHVTGTCVFGCVSGWKGEDCNEVCSPGFFGAECEEKCGLCANNSTCDASSGNCSSGCVEGYMGPQCKDQNQRHIDRSEAVQSVPVAAVVGAAVGVVLVALVIILIVLLIRRRQRGKRSSDESALKETPHVPANKKNLRDEGNTYMNVGFDDEVKPTLLSKKTPTTPAHVASVSPPPVGHQGEIRKIQSGNKRDNVLVDRPRDSQGQPDMEDEEEYDAHAQIAPQDAPGHADINYYNLGDARPCHAIPVSSFATRVQKMEDHPEEEFKHLPDGFMHSYEESQKSKNKGKNGFRGYYPYDYNRVILHDANDDDRGDYVNASYLDGYKSEKRYIAAQGPYKPDVLVDFWKMIWQEGCNTVVMVTGLVEACKMKCLQYWPEKDGVTFGDIKVTLAARTQLANYTITKLAVQNEKEGKKRDVNHLHFTSWPDHGVPDIAALLDFMWRVRVISGQQTQPIIVHCSAGIGRTGTYITIDSLVEQAQAEGVVDVVSFVSNMRGQRKNMIQTKEQYLFIYQALARDVSEGDTTLDAASIRHLDLGQVLDVNMGNRTVQQHLQILKRSGGGHPKGAKITSVPSYASLNGFFIVSSPPDKEEMWNQVYNSDSHTLITYAADVLDYLPSVDASVATSRFEVSMSKSTALSDDILLNTMELKLKDNDDTTVIQHYHITGSARNPSFNFLTDNFLTWTKDPKRGLCTVVTESVEEFRFLVLLLNIASRLQDDGRVDVINNMRHLYTRLGGPPFTESDVRLCLEFTRQRTETHGVYANF
ncbi:uncharacterized protein LOC124268014 isoform X1 [Haliotis rubra]|uniref:uncharacterized protein LOC124268014 isoform X1 n=1 Tax=Haliotis rubra TaxID=36100 RepID=UPI001EE4F32B|nr:uncharacterized protein LOC124268014 isoform X1 [Haliotis rubra]